jgi:5S rRNA maturation endonuclease (ribonuclease M5)|tara:strand:+ start:380 stop:778 length:399 start_codon:yes stop_codon:yes gene_type:complete
MQTEVLNRKISEALVLYIKKLNDESKNGSLVVVEGKRDVRALRSMGFIGKILMLCHNNNFDRFISEAGKYHKIILLLDLDRKGRSLTKKAAILLEGKKHVIDLYFRRNLSSITCGRVKQIEELSKYAEYIVI